MQADALVRYFIDNKAITNSRNLPEPYIYKFHHDGPRRDYGGFILSMENVYPKIKSISDAIYKVF